jgi:hypothetical protein
MQIRIFKIAPLFLLIFPGFFASSSEITQNNHQKSFKSGAFVKESVNKNPYNPYNYDCIVNTVSVQINVPQHRNVHFWKVVNCSPNTYITTVQYLNFICGRGNRELSRFRKLILFPFHVFW